MSVQHPADHAAPRWKRPAAFALKLTIGCILIGWLLWTGRFDPRVYRELSTGRAAWCLLGVVAGQSVMLLVPLFRWWLLVRAQGLPITLGTAIRLGLKGAFANLFVPGGLGIDGLRLLYLHRQHRELWIPGVSSVVLDRVLGVLGLVLLGGLCAVLLLWYAYNDWVFQLVLLCVFLATALLFGLSLACGFLGNGITTVFRRFHWMSRMATISSKAPSGRSTTPPRRPSRRSSW